MIRILFIFLLWLKKKGDKMSIKELTIKMIVSNQKIKNLTNQLIELRKYAIETEFLLLNEINVNNQFEQMLKIELVCEEIDPCAN